MDPLNSELKAHYDGQEHKLKYIDEESVPATKKKKISALPVSATTLLRVKTIRVGFLY
jgi:hypothetical protein